VNDIDILRVMRETHGPYIVHDTLTDPFWIEIPNHTALRSGICLPLYSTQLHSTQRLVGVLMLIALPVGYYSSKTAERLRGVLSLLSIAITNAQINQQLNRQAQLVSMIQDRQAVAVKLYDSVTQTLFSASTIAESLKLLGSQAENAPGYIELLAVMTRNALLEMRSMAFELQPETLLNTELSAVMKQLCDTFSLKTGIPVVFKVSDKIVLTSEVQFTFYRVVQEALSNIEKHANAKEVSVSLSQENNEIQLKVADNGAGFDPHMITAGNCRRGLCAVRERVRKIQADLIINSTVGQGTEIVLRCQTPYLAS
jgi:signal transduction histidine kinase